MILALGGLVLVAVVLGVVLFAGGAGRRGPVASGAPLMRACPACGSELKAGENILAERTGVVKGGRERIIIKGCPHCLGSRKPG